MYADTDIDSSSGGSASSEVLELEGNLGWFATPNVELGGSLAYSDTDVDIGTVRADADAALAGVTGRYYFVSSGTSRPYVGLGAGILDGSVQDTDFDGIYYGVGAGVLVFVTESVAFDMGVRQVWSDEDWSASGGGDADIDRDILALSIGLSFTF